MQKTLLRLVWPYILRYLAKHGAVYLEKRREQKRLLKATQAEAAAVSPDSSDVAVVECPSPPAPPPIWYVLAGVLLGSAISLMLVKLLRE
ncbi:MAG: hypothetical protein DPW09_14145 [Anaerolineae bacterium]|nr:hypothetical protein [Anaerolineales bacterium]MCQ3974578.1 hypothetical protein [Anaerolineae bacterium]